MTSPAQAIGELVEPLVIAAGLELWDVEVNPRAVRVLVDRPGGIDIDSLANLARTVSAELDGHDDLSPGAQYHLEVSSPGIERALRTASHFQRYVGTEVLVKTAAPVDGTRRLQGLLLAVDGDGVTIDLAATADPQLSYEQIQKARSVLVWGPQPKRAQPKRPPGPTEAQPQGGSGQRTPHDERQLRLPRSAAADRRDKGISVDTLLDALANALVAAYKRTPGAAEEAVVTVDPDSGDIRVYGQELDEDGNVVREWDDTPKDFGRIAAQTAKQVILQRIREAERDLKYEEYAGREGDIVTGIIQQSDNRYTLLDLGKVEALLPQAEQVPYERYEHGARLKAYIVEVRKTTKGPQIVVSRTHPGLIKRLFELEVPEISSGVVEIKAAARSRAIAPRSRCGPTTPTSTRSAPVSAPGGRGSGWSPTSSGAKRSTSSPIPTSPASS